MAPEHAAYWRNQELRDYSGGPFEDRSGGLITFSADSLDDAQQLVRDDPFIKAVYWNSTGLRSGKAVLLIRGESCEIAFGYRYRGWDRRITTAAHLARRGMKVTVFEKNERPVAADHLCVRALFRYRTNLIRHAIGL
jgi:hypothetical protein